MNNENMTSCCELEINNVWAQENPRLYMESVREFHFKTKDIGLTKRHIDRSREGFTVYMAEKQ